MIKKFLLGVLLLGSLVLALAACMPVTRVASFNDSTPLPQTPQAQTAVREAQVQSVEVQILKSDPVQINAVARGVLTEACATLGESRISYAANTFQITISVNSPSDRGCAQITTPFESTIPLDAVDLAAGTYTVTVNGLSKVFTVPVANVTPTPGSTSTVKAVGSINGWLWHDWCPVSGQPFGAGKDTNGCVREGDHYRANGVKENNEAIIPNVKVNLGAGPCPSIGLAEADTLVTDLSYSFMALNPGVYCVSIDPLAGSNSLILKAGAWTYPNHQDGLISTTVNLSAGENKFDVNFGWDYTNLPSTQSTACTYRAAFLGDVSVPDNTVVAPGASFVKTWRLRNDGNCAWGPGQYVHTLVFANGDRLGAPDEVPLPMTVPPGGIGDISINMIAPVQPGTYRSEWMLMIAEGPLLGVGQDGRMALYAQIVVPSPATPTPVARCQDSAQYTSDDGRDGTTYAPNMPFNKTWRLRNTGTCTWDSSYLIAYMAGAAMAQQPGYWIVQPGQTVAPGQTVDISVGMTSPVDNGDYTSYWGLKKVNGAFMPIQGGANGNSVYVKIRVNNGISGRITDQSIRIELEQGSGAACTATSTYFVHAQITVDGPTTAVYEIGSTAGQIPAGNFQNPDNNGLSPYVTGAVVFDQAGTKTIHLRFVGPYPYPDNITVNLRINGGEWYNTRLACQ